MKTTNLIERGAILTNVFRLAVQDNPGFGSTTQDHRQRHVCRDQFDFHHVSFSCRLFERGHSAFSQLCPAANLENDSINHAVL
ncbi:MAG: hypothetical protein ABSF38_16550 [Verrucomicrobiota bacterium]